MKIKTFKKCDPATLETDLCKSNVFEFTDEEHQENADAIYDFLSNHVPTNSVHLLMARMLSEMFSHYGQHSKEQTIELLVQHAKVP